MSLGRGTLKDERLWENPPLWFLVHLWQGGRLEFGYGMDPETGGPGAVYFSARDGSWCELTRAASDGTRQVWEGGPAVSGPSSRQRHSSGISLASQGGTVSVSP